MIKKLFANFFNIWNTETISPGNAGEIIACRFIKGEGYRIIEKNFRSRFGEIDMVAEERETLAFIEVKSRKRFDYGHPEEFVDRRKQEKLLKTASVYLVNNSIKDRDIRFDVVSVDLGRNKSR